MAPPRVAAVGASQALVVLELELDSVPGTMPSCSRMGWGIVTCPLLVTRIELYQ